MMTVILKQCVKGGGERQWAKVLRMLLLIFVTLSWLLFATHGSKLLFLPPNCRKLRHCLPQLLLLLLTAEAVLHSSACQLYQLLVVQPK
jgi:hypothetical protein